MPNQILSGYLHKRAIRNGRTWKRRFFVLTELVLSYYKTDADALTNAKSRGDFPINAQTTIVSSDAKEFAMEIITDNPPISLVIAADSQKEFAQWFETIEKLIEVAKKAPTPLDTSHVCCCCIIICKTILIIYILFVLYFVSSGTSGNSPKFQWKWIKWRFGHFQKDHSRKKGEQCVHHQHGRIGR